MFIIGLNRAQLLGFLRKGGTVAEVGVFRGIFSKQIQRIVQPDVLHLIDPWSSQSGSSPMEGPRNEAAFEELQAIFQEEIASGQIVLHRDYSTEVARLFPDEHFDWVYVDAMHDFENVLADLRAFKHKVKPNGFLLGHDFSNSVMSRKRGFGVVRAVREFVAGEGFQLVLITNEANPSYLLAHADNSTTLPALRNSLLTGRGASPIEVDESLLDRFQQVDVAYANGRKGRLLRFG